MNITIYRRHSADCPETDDRYAPRCGCPLSFQFNWRQASTTLDGKKLERGQNKWTANTRSWSEAQTNAKKLEKDLENLLQGKTVRHGVTVEAVVNEWLEFREKNRLTNTKPNLMGQKLIERCENNGIFLLTAITTNRVMKFRMSLPFRTGTAAASRCIGPSSTDSSIGHKAWDTSTRIPSPHPGRIRSSPFGTPRRK
jgi:hypothetical protein